MPCVSPTSERATNVTKPVVSPDSHLVLDYRFFRKWNSCARFPISRFAHHNWLEPRYGCVKNNLRNLCTMNFYVKYLQYFTQSLHFYDRTIIYRNLFSGCLYSYAMLMRPKKIETSYYKF